MKNLYPDCPIVVVDDEENFLESIKISFKYNNISHFQVFSNGNEALDYILKNDVSMVLLDLYMPVISGEEVLKKIKEERPDLPVIIITAVNEIDTAICCFRNGAHDYIIKPIDPDVLINTIEKTLKIFELNSEIKYLKDSLLKDRLEHPKIFSSIITDHPKMKSIFKYMEAISRTTQPVLVTGETGVGKELVANVIYQLSGQEGSFIAVNIAGVDDTLFSDTLFGHQKGAYTGADKKRKGLIEQAAFGTIFLDEIGDLELASQIKLLRLLQEKTYFPLGSDQPKKSNARVIVATNKDLKKMVQKGEFRKDLFYRLQTHIIQIPSLKERKEDIPLLVQYFVKKIAKELKIKPPSIKKELYALLNNYPFPGNIRELESMIYNAMSLHKGNFLSLQSFRERISAEIQVDEADLGPVDSASEADEESFQKVRFTEVLPTLQEMDNLLINEALRRSEGNKTLAASLIGISRVALQLRIKRRKEKNDLK